MKITVGQALLKLLEHYHDNPEKKGELQRLYLRGADSPEKLNAINDYLNDPVLGAFEISRDPNDINNDPSRRYFETHLCANTLSTSIGAINEETLQAQQQNLLNLVSAGMHRQKPIAEVLAGDYAAIERMDRESDNPDPKAFLAEKEYAFAIHSINLEVQSLQGKLSSTQNEAEQSDLQKQISDLRKSAILIGNGYLGAKAAQSNTMMPLGEIYNSDYYSTKARGNVPKQEQETTQTQNLGIIQGKMPLPRDDIALSDVTYTFKKPSESSTFDISKEWVQNNFSQLVHPHSNSISGTMLGQIRSNLMAESDENYLLMIQELASKAPQFLDRDPKSMSLNELMTTFNASDKAISIDNTIKINQEDYYRNFIAAMLFRSGGHTLNEFTAPLSLDSTQKYLDPNAKLTLESMFLDTNQVAFEKSIQEAIAYNNQLLKKAAVNQEIKDVHNPTLENPLMMHLKLTKEKKEQIANNIGSMLGKHADLSSEYTQNAISRWTKFIQKNFQEKERPQQIVTLINALQDLHDAIDIQASPQEYATQWKNLVALLQNTREQITAKNPNLQSRLDRICASILTDMENISNNVSMLSPTPRSDKTVTFSLEGKKQQKQAIKEPEPDRPSATIKKPPRHN